MFKLLKHSFLLVTGTAVVSAAAGAFVTASVMQDKSTVASTVEANAVSVRPFYAKQPLLVHEGKEIFLEDLPEGLQVQTKYIMDSYRQQMESVAVDVAVLLALSESGTKVKDLKSLAVVLGDRVKPSAAEVAAFVSRTRQSFHATMSDEAIRVNSERMLAAQKIAIERNAVRNTPDFDKTFVIPYARPKATPTVAPTQSPEK